VSISLFIDIFVEILNTSMKKVLIVSATAFEIQPFLEFLKQNTLQKYNPLFGLNGYEFDVLITGVGIANTAFTLGKAFGKKHYDFALNVGVAGSFNRKILRGDVVEVISEQYGDLGVEEADGRFTDIFELGLIDKDSKPFKDAKLLNINPLKLKTAKPVTAITVQKVNGFTDSIEAVLTKYSVDIETMEGAAFFQACLTEGVAFSQIRAISNYVEPRNRDNWKMKEAIDNLNVYMIYLFEKRII
jgi:futalosine hydrolase